MTFKERVPSTSKFYVAVAPSGALVVLRPLFFLCHETALERMQGYSIFLADTTKPDAYVMDYGDKSCPIFNSTITKSVEMLGEL